jgi:hypothetical protein
MNELAGLTLLILGFSAVVIPLVALWRRGRLNSQFPWVFGACAFLVLNGPGAFSANVLDGFHSPTFYFLMLATSISLAVAFVLCDRLGVAYDKNVQILGMARVAQSEDTSLRISLILLWLFSLLSVFVFAVAISPPLLFRFDLYGDWEELIATRIAIVKTANFDWFALGFFDLPLFALILSATMAHVTSQAATPAARFWRLARVVALTYATLTSIMFLHRHYVVYVLMAAFLVSVWARGLSVGRAMFFLIIAVSTIFALYAAYGGTEVVNTLANTMWHRAFEVYPWTAAEVTDVFTREQDFLYGRSIINVFDAFPYEQIDLAAQMYPRIYGNLGIGAALGSTPVPAVFESFANFGWTGSVVTLAVLIAAIAGVHVLWRHDSPWIVALSVFLTVKLALFWQGPLWFGFLEPSLLVLVAALTLWYLGTRFLSAR